MAEKTKIEWTEATWNPWHGCHKVSPGCKNCYMFREKKHYGQDPNVVVRSKTKFYDPLKWKEPRTIFTCSWSDFFIEEADPWRDEAFAIMALTPHHTYQVLTKRPDRMLEYLSSSFRLAAIAKHMQTIAGNSKSMQFQQDAFNILQSLNYLNFVLPNVWLGVSVEDQKTADERIPLLLQTPAALRWLSIEPLLGPVDLEEVNTTLVSHYDVLRGAEVFPDGYGTIARKCDGVNWAVAGGESGPDARPMHPDWVRSLRDQCTAAGVPFFFKQWGEWFPVNSQADDLGEHGDVEVFTDSWKLRGEQHDWDDYSYSVKIGKTKAGRLLDRREWSEMPEVSR